jgi:hypothetical protein
MAEAERIERRANAFVGMVAGAGEAKELLSCREVLEEVVAGSLVDMREEASASMGPMSGPHLDEVLAGDRDEARCRDIDGRDHPQERTLPAARRTDDGGGHSRVDIEVDAAHSLDATGRRVVHLDEVFAGDQWLTRHG